MSKYDVFISYKRKDGAGLARYFDSELQSNGYSTFLDVKSLHVGSFPLKLEEAIKDSDMVLALLTKSSMDSLDDEGDFTRKEIMIALDNDKPLFLLSDMDDIYAWLDEHDGAFYEQLKVQNIIEYDHNNTTDILEKLKNVLEAIKDQKFTINKMGESNKEHTEIDVDGILYTYIGELRGGVPYNQGELKDDVQGIRYRGEWFGWHDPRLSGSGKIYQDNKLIYMGDWKSLEFNGGGATWYGVGKTYKGDFKDGKFNGYGELAYDNGKFAKGEWKDDVLEGHVEIRTLDGEEYIGQLRDEKFHGLGTCIYTSGDKYEGDFVNSKRQGQGVMNYENGLTYTGEWVVEKAEGKGILTGPDASYDGDWVDGAYDGVGLFIYKDGSQYRGQWSNGRRAGNGALLDSEGDLVHRGSWDDQDAVAEKIGSERLLVMEEAEIKLTRDMLAGKPVTPVVPLNINLQRKPKKKRPVELTDDVGVEPVKKVEPVEKIEPVKEVKPVETIEPVKQTKPVVVKESGIKKILKTLKKIMKFTMVSISVVAVVIVAFFLFVMFSDSRDMKGHDETGVEPVNKSAVISEEESQPKTIEKEVNQEVTLRTVSQFGGTDVTAGVYEAILDDFQAENPWITVEDESATADETWYADVAADFDAGNEPDVIYTSTGMDAWDMIEEGQVVSINEIRAEFPDYASNILDNVLNSVKEFDGNAYSVPVRGYYNGLFVNKKIFNDCGLELPTDWVKMERAIEGLRQNDIIPIAVALGEMPHYWVESLILSQGGVEVHDEWDIGEVKNEWVAGLGYFKRLSDMGAFPGNTNTVESDAVVDGFSQGKAGMMLGGSWIVGRFENPDDITVMPLPLVPGGAADPSDIIGGFDNGWYITTKAWEDPEKRAAAVKFVSEMTSTDAISNFLLVGSTPAADIELFPGLPQVEIDGFKMQENAANLEAPMDSWRLYSVWDKLLDSIPGIATGEEDIEAVVEELIMLNN